MYWGVVNSIINNKNVCIHPYLRSVESGKEFKLKVNDDRIIATIKNIEELARILHDVPMEAIEFHMNGRNDFSEWIRNAIGDEKLATLLSYIEFRKSEDVRKALITIIENRIKNLRRNSVNLIFE
ncbi:MAG: hypothetical protein DRO90_03195 [Candidatus Altiarchaeales archaeon]|nr:MAG: hypothetical protein DRO90_03195 [Candidatus Altiarchaeales archaeon]